MLLGIRVGTGVIEGIRLGAGDCKVTWLRIGPLAKGSALYYITILFQLTHFVLSFSYT